MKIADQRRSERFELRLPFELVREGSRPINETGETRNLSSAGVLFTSTQELEIGAPIEYVITLQRGTTGNDSVRLHCVGKVVRYHRSEGEPSSEDTVQMAATLERYQFVRPER